MAKTPFSRRRWILTGIGFFVSVVLFILAALPTMLGEKWIYQPLVDRMAVEDFKLTVGKVRLRWLSPLRFEQLAITQSDGKNLLTIDQIRTNRSLLGYLLGGRQLGRIEIDKPTVDLALLEDGTNLQRLVAALEDRVQSSKEPKEPRKSKPKLNLEVAVIDLSAKVQRPADPEPLVVIPPFDLQVSYRSLDGPTRVIVAPTSVLNEVELTQELIELGLGHAIPLLAKSAWFDGKVSLDIGELDIPLDAPIDSTGTAVLTLHQVRSGPAQPAVLDLLELVSRLREQPGTPELVFVDGSQIKIQVADQRVTHSGMRAGLPKVDERFQLATSGSVGLLDKQLDLLLELPLPIEQLARRDEIKELGVPTLGLPIRGTLDEPQVEWRQMRDESAALLGIMRQRLEKDAPKTASVLGALEGLAGGQADQAIAAGVGLIQELRKQRQIAREQTAREHASEGNDGQSEDSQPRSRPLRDLFRRRQ